MLSRNFEGTWQLFDMSQGLGGPAEQAGLQGPCMVEHVLSVEVRRLASSRCCHPLVTNTMLLDLCEFLKPV
jgi:hypothetical protein